MRDKLLRTDTEGWNNEWYVHLGAPLLAVVGAILGQLFGVHLVSSTLGEVLVLALFVGAAMLVGLGILAVVDGR